MQVLKLQVILKYIQLDGAGEMAMEIIYSEYQPGECGLPGRISVSSRGHSGNLLLRLSNWQTGAAFSPSDFEFELPPGFKRVQVK